jgi:hypothetical protein
MEPILKNSHHNPTYSFVLSISTVLLEADLEIFNSEKLLTKISVNNIY